MASPCETGKCRWCGRRAIRVNQCTGQFLPHRTRTGRKGLQCPGSDKHRDSKPEDTP